jgi:hypothetical protein
MTFTHVRNSVLTQDVENAAAMTEARSDADHKLVIVWEHTEPDDDDGMVYQWRRKE